MTASPILLTLCLLCACTGPRGVQVERSVITMGTRLRVEVAATTLIAADEAAEACVQTVLAADRRWSSWRSDSTLRRVHAAPGGHPVPVDGSFAAGLRRALGWAERTGGTFDPTIGQLLAAWGIGRSSRSGAPAALSALTAPTATALARARAAAGPELVAIAANSVTLRGSVRLAEGGFAKGLALDGAIRVARMVAGVTAIRLDFGGQLAWWSRAEDPRRIRVASPDDRQRAVATIELPAEGSVATTGNSEHAILVDGVRRSHILDPRTGQPALDWGSVTVIVTGVDHPACAADCLSTALFVLGPSEGLRLATRLPGVDALFLERTDDGLRSHRTPGMRDSTHRDDSQAH